jgi:hypothetical protein
LESLAHTNRILSLYFGIASGRRIHLQQIRQPISLNHVLLSHDHQPHPGSGEVQFVATVSAQLAPTLSGSAPALCIHNWKRHG